MNFLDVSLNSQIDFVLVHVRRLNPTDTSFGFGTALYLACDSSPCVCARGGRSSKTEAKAQLQKLGVQCFQTT